MPPLGPQAQRRTQSTLATDAGATGLMVAQHLGQAVPDTAPVVTRQHDIGRSEASNAQVDRAVRVLEGLAIADRTDRLGTDLGTTAAHPGASHPEHVLTS